MRHWEFEGKTSLIDPNALYGKMELLEMVGGVLKLVRFQSTRNGFTTQIWDGLMRWEISRKVFGYGQEKEVGYGKAERVGLSMAI